MNLTQNNPAGCTAVVEAGALAPVAALLAQMVRGGPKIKGRRLACVVLGSSVDRGRAVLSRMVCGGPRIKGRHVLYRVGGNGMRVSQSCLLARPPDMPLCKPAAGVVAGREELAVWLDELR